MKEKKHFNKIDKKIIQILYSYKIPLTIYRIAKEADISYPTAKIYVEELVKQSILISVKENEEKK